MGGYQDVNNCKRGVGRWSDHRKRLQKYRIVNSICFICKDLIETLVIFTRQQFPSIVLDWSNFNCKRLQRVGGQLIVNNCKLGVGGWSKNGEKL